MPQGGGSDPCTPNPCGDNSLCKANGNAGAIACYCQPGYDQIDPDDPWACVPVALDGSSSGIAAGGIQRGSTLDLDQVTPRPEITTTTTRKSPTRTTTDRPSFLPPKETVIGTDAFGNTRIFTAAASSLDNESEEDYYSQDDESNAVSNNNDVLDIGVSEPRNPPPSIADRRRPPARPQQTIEPFTGPQAEHRLVGLSVDEIYNAECLINDDCDFDKFCDVKEKVCKDPCIFLRDVCGVEALCKVKIHRPLCYCPDGLVGNPHEQCKQAPSRAGTRF